MFERPFINIEMALNFKNVNSINRLPSDNNQPPEPQIST